ncbi:oligosaccharide flippase family protein [Cognatiluteimonas profundi]|uniref:oligosaccharide flippase family protein n=1 Tax=Cognatiluteimonas profundi TaxID=2594501 RepID=UPI00131E8114|nr:oligosaccharide flippase family protein [Lysobacter profundi]
MSEITTLSRFNLRKNVSFAAAELFVNTALLFFGYRMVIKQGGVEAVGVWATLYAWTNLIRLGDVGVAAAATRFLALWNVTDDREKVRVYGETALLTNVIQFGVLATLAYFAIGPFVERLVGANHAAEALRVLPLLVFGFFLLNISGTLLGILQGLHMGYRRSQLSVLGTVIQLLVVLLLVPAIGLRGLAWAQIVQHSIVAVVCWVIIRRKMGSAFVPTCFDRVCFRAMLGYSVKAQVVNLSSGLVDPISKALVGHFGGMTAQGLYELAYKTVLLPRNLVASGVTAATPTMAALFHKDRGQLRRVYARAFRLSAGLMAITSLGLIAFAPLPSLLWLGRINTTYWLYVALLSAGFFGNVLGAPAYVLGMASGRLGNNILVTVLVLALLLVLGISTGSIWGGAAAVAATSFAIGFGGIAIWLMNRKLVDPDNAPDEGVVESHAY